MFKTSNILQYFAPRPAKPIIVSPKTDDHWSSEIKSTFEWIYSGNDLQYEYRIQIFNIPSDVIWKRNGIVLTKSSWDDESVGNYATWYKRTSDNNYADILSEAGSGYSFYEINNIGNNKSVYVDTFNFVDENLNPSTGITDDGIYIWRIQTKGTIARSWSNWSYDGLFRIDSASPSIRNANTSSVYKMYPNINSISDMSSPTSYNVRSDGTKDYGVLAKRGLYISYDYSENSVVLKCSGSNFNDDPRRFYGMISFHPDSGV